MYNPYDIYDNSGGSDGYAQVRVEYKRNRTRGKKNESAAINAGGAIIIIIFVVLCLTIFGLLSFTTAFADKKLADRNLLNIRQYYEADALASEKLAKIYNAVYSHYSNYSETQRDKQDKQDKLNLSQLDLSDLSDLTDVTLLTADLADMPESGSGGFSSEITVSYVTPMNNIQAILSEIKFYYDKDKNKLSYKIYEWKVVLTSEFDSFQYEDKGMNLIDPFAWD